MDKITKAKKLLRLGIDTGDDELIMMAHEILGIDDTEVEHPVTETEKPTPQPADIPRNTDFSVFTMKNDDDANKKNGVAVNKIKRQIQFVDDGSDKNITTPDIARAERKRIPFKMVEQKCQKCGIIVETHPQHKREWFVCDRCIKR